MVNQYYLYETDNKFIASYYALHIDGKNEIKSLGTSELSSEELKEIGYVNLGGDYWIKEKK